MARSARLDDVDQGLPGVLWAALALGAVVTVGYALLVALIGVLLTVALAIDHPFAGDVAVAPHPLERVLADFGRPGG